MGVYLDRTEIQLAYHSHSYCRTFLSCIHHLFGYAGFRRYDTNKNIRRRFADADVDLCAGNSVNDTDNYTNNNTGTEAAGAQAETRTKTQTNTKTGGKARPGVYLKP